MRLLSPWALLAFSAATANSGRLAFWPVFGILHGIGGMASDAGRLTPSSRNRRGGNAPSPALPALPTPTAPSVSKTTLKETDDPNEAGSCVVDTTSTSDASPPLPQSLSVVSNAPSAVEKKPPTAAAMVTITMTVAAKAVATAQLILSHRALLTWPTPSSATTAARTWTCANPRHWEVFGASWAATAATTDTNGTTTEPINIGASKADAVDDSSDSGTFNTALRNITLLFSASIVFWCAGCICAARRPLRHGGKVLSGQKESLGFRRRLLAVLSLGLVCGGASTAYLMLLMYAACWAWFGRGYTAGYIAILITIGMLKLYTIPLHVNKTRVPMERLSHPVFKLWREYFAFSCIFDEGLPSNSGERSGHQNIKMVRRQRRSSSTGRHKQMSKSERRRRRKMRLDGTAQTYMLAQMPHGIMPFGAILGVGVLADARKALCPIGGVAADVVLRAPLLRRFVNWVGVRRASLASILGMFQDGFKAVGVVTGGVAEIFLSWRTERIVAPRPNFANIALKGGHDIIIVFVYGASRTHRVVCGSYWASKKVGFPLLIGYGSFLSIPYREAMQMVVSEPIVVNKVENPTSNDVTILRKRIEAEMHRLYYHHRPDWESRPLQVVRGESSAAELEALKANASASTASSSLCR